MVFLGKYLSFFLISLSLLSSTVLFAKDPEPTNFEEMSILKEQPAMKWVQKFKNDFKEEIDESDMSENLGYLENLISTHPEAFIMFHARDSEEIYSWFDALSLFHPLHEEFMSSFALIRTSSSAGFASGDGSVSDRKPLIYRDPRNYVKHLVSRGLNVERLLKGREHVIAIIGGGTGVQATGAFATLIAAFKGHPQFREIALNIAENYLIYKGGEENLVNLERPDFIAMLKDSSQTLSDDFIVEQALQVNPTYASSEEFGYLYQSIGWAGTSVGFDNDGNPELNNEGRRYMHSMYSIFKNWGAPALQERAARLIETRVAARRAFLGNNRKVKPIKVKPYEKPLKTSLDHNLQQGDKFILTSKRKKYVVEKLIGSYNSAMVYSVREFRKDGRRFSLIVPTYEGQTESLQQYDKALKSLQAQGIVPRNTRSHEKFIAVPENSPFLEWINHSNLKSGFSIQTKDGLLTFKIVKQLNETSETRVFVLKDAKNRRFLLTVPKDIHNSENLEKIAKEVRRTQGYQEYGIATLPIIASAENFILKHFKGGVSLAKVIAKWEKDGFPEDNPAINAMLDLFESNAKKGIYLTRALSDNFMFVNKQIISIRAAALKTDVPYEDIMKEYNDVLKDRFGEKFVERLIKK